MEVWKTEDPRVNFEKRFAHYEIYTWTLCHSYIHEKQTSRIQSLNNTEKQREEEDKMTIQHEANLYRQRYNIYQRVIEYNEVTKT